MEIKQIENLDIHQELSFDEIKPFVAKIVEESGYTPARTGIFDVAISNRGKKYFFEKLKQSGGYNDDLIGFGLNHYGWYGLNMPKFKKSKFHDSEDVDIDIWRHEFISASYSKVLACIFIKTKNWNSVVSWGEME